MKTSKINRIVITSIAAGAILSAHGAVTVLTDPGDIAAFKSGATVENFDNLPALTATAYAPATDATGFTFSSRDPVTSPTFDSTGASPGNPASNPGLPVVVLKPTVGISGDVSSTPNVIGPIIPNFDPGATPTALDPKANSMEIAFPQNKDATKVGFFVTHGTVFVQVQDDGLTLLESETVSAGSFVTFARASADIRNVSLVSSSGTFTIDDFTYSFDGGTTTTTPDGGATLSLALSALGLGVAKWRVRARKA